MASTALFGCGDGELDDGGGGGGADQGRVGRRLDGGSGLDRGLTGPSPDARLPGPDSDIRPRFDMGPSRDSETVPFDFGTPDDLGSPDDQGVTPPDRGPVGPLAATIVLAEQPQGPTASIAAAISAPIELVESPGCVVVAVDPNAPVDPVFSADGGDLIINGVRNAPIVVRRDAQGIYAPEGNVPNDLFNDGDRVTAQGNGGPDFAPFEIQLAAPSRVNLRSPDNLDSVQAGGGLTVSWTAGEGDAVVVSVFPAASSFDPTPRRGDWIICGGADNGRLDVPAEQLRPLGGSPPFGRAAVVAVTRTRFTSVPVGAQTAYLAITTSTGALINVMR